MIKNRRANNFSIQELVPKSIYELRGDKAWQLIDSRLIDNLNALREQIGVPMRINNWFTGGTRTQGGLRIPGQSHYSPTSQHTFGRAVDIVCTVEAEDIRELIKLGDVKLPHLACFEDNVHWLHMDVRNTDNKSHYFFRV